MSSPHLGENSSLGNDDKHEHHHGSTLLFKILAMIILSSVSILMGLIPVLNSKFSNSSGRCSSTIKILMGFGGGVLLATIFIHLLPEVSNEMNEILKEETTDFGGSVVVLIIFFGFFLMYLVEEVIEIIIKKQQKKAEDELKKISIPSISSLVRDVENDCSNSHHQDCESDQHGHHAHHRHHSHHSHHSHEHHNHHGHSHIPAVILENTKSSLSGMLEGFFIILGISTHELFEGLALGFMAHQNDVLQMFLAVAIHKFVIAFCLGVQLRTYNIQPTFSIIYITIFALVSPLGIGIGIGIMEVNNTTSNGPTIIPLVLQAIATGTLLYVVFFEILQENRRGIIQFLSILVGFILIAVIQLYTGHNHHHHHGEGHDHHH